MSVENNTIPDVQNVSSAFSFKKFFLACSLVLLLCLIALFYTNKPLQLLLKLIPEHSPVQLGQISGTLAEGLTLTDVHFAQNGIELRVNTLTAKVGWYCLGRLEICVDAATAQGVHLVFSPATEPAAPSEDSVLELPKVSINQLHVSDLTLLQGDLQLSLKNLSTELNFGGQQLLLGDTLLDQLQLQLPETSEPKSTTASAEAWWHYQVPELQRIELPLWLSVKKLTLLQAEITGAQQFSVQQLSFSLEANPDQFDLTALQLTGLETSQPDLQGHVFNAEAQLSLTNSTPFALQGFIKADSGSFVLDSSIAGSLEELQLKLELTGAQQATAQIEIAPLSAGLPLSLQLNASNLQWPLQGEALYKLHSVAVDAKGALADLQLSVQSQQQLPQLPDSQLQLTALWQAPLLSWSTLNLTSSLGSVSSAGTLDLTKDLALDATLALDKLQLEPWLKEYPGQLSGDVRLKASYHQQQWQLELPTLAIQGQVRQQPLSLSGQLAAKGKALNVEKLSSKTLILQHGNNSIKAEGEVTDQWQMLLLVTAPDLASSVVGAQGSLSAEAKVTGPQQYPAVDLTLQAQKLRYKKLLRLQSMSLNAQINSNNLDHQLELILGKGMLSGQTLNSAQLLMTGNKNSSDLVLQLDATDYKAQLQAAAAAKPKQQWQISVQQAQLQTPVGHWALAESLPIALDWPKQQLALPAHCWTSEPGQLCLEKPSTVSSSQGDLSVTLQQFQLALLEPFIGESQRLTGEATADLQLNWGKKQGLNAAVKLTGTAGRWQQTDVNPLQLPWQSWNAAVQLTPKQLSSNWQMQFSEDRSLTGSASLPDLSAEDKKLEAELTLSRLDLSFLRTLLPEQSEFVATLNGQVRASGTLNRPLLSGQLAVSEVKLHGTNAPLDIEQGSMQLDFLQQKAILTADIQSGEGKAQLSGYADWFDLKNYQARLALSGQELPLNLSQGMVYINPEITVLAQNQVVAVQGTVQIPRAELAIDDLPQNAVQISDDEILLNKELEVRRGAVTSSIKLVTEMRLILGDEVRLQAFGLKSRLKGQLLFSQNEQQQRLRGEVNILDGTFRSYGQDLLIRKGKLIFNGPVDQPFLNIEAIRNPSSTEDDVIAGIRVNGPADQASVVIFSEPSKPQANALSYLLMGRDLSGSGDSKSNPLTSGLIGLGIANSNGMVSQLGQALGFEQFTLDTAGSGDDSQVTVSGYLSPKLQLKYGVGIFNSLGEFTLRYELMKNFYLEAVQGIDSAVDVLYKFEFD
ncbi:translocation/assembly module TamB domain-containing protein [Rheinheimera sp. 1928-s]|uniref:autotransporter assembly complex protein TamB n=1 Tax=Rheinheimera sp. 1928-s TaxID=3033803 RepID=UPI00262AD7CA|nr:translocation/assembly module TamB domain-containing protein [Rheinheimera sp. 1928-s]MDF3125522.1 translocation/assembly module TamB domain-containing protein [Rheinheimera sp. 1928-s]